AGSVEKALPYYEQALAMTRRLYPQSKYPDGHADLARSLNSMGSVLRATGSAKKALPFYGQALAMQRALYPKSAYPDGHPDLASRLNNIGCALRAIGAAAKALPFYELGLAMTRTLGQRLLLTFSETDALAYVQAQPRTRDGYLSAAVQLPGT